MCINSSSSHLLIFTAQETHEDVCLRELNGLAIEGGGGGSVLCKVHRNGVNLRLSGIVPQQNCADCARQLMSVHLPAL